MSSDDRTYYRVPVPKPILRLFGKVPLRTYPPNKLPTSPISGNENTLFVFTTSEEAKHGGPSFNPGCLKWQTLLRFRGIPFETFPSNNHASPTGALPFLLPASSGPSINPPPDPITSIKLHTFGLRDDNSPSPKEPPSHGVYYTLLAHPIRLAYLYALYLTPLTFANVAAPLYVDPGTRSRIVRQARSWPLRAAALEEVTSAYKGRVQEKHGSEFSGVDEEKMMADAAEAFNVINDLLGSSEWFSNTTEAQKAQGHSPGLLDAAVFSYVHVILTLFDRGDAEIDSPARSLANVVSRSHNLTAHRERILQLYYR